MTTIAVILLVVLLWFLVGCIVLSLQDNGQHELLQWASNCPYIGLSGFILLWPISLVLIIYLKNK